MQFEKTQEENQQLIQQTREDSYKIGFKEGEEKAKNDLNASIDAEKNIFYNLSPLLIKPCNNHKAI